MPERAKSLFMRWDYPWAPEKEDGKNALRARLMCCLRLGSLSVCRGLTDSSEFELIFGLLSSVTNFCVLGFN